MILIRPSLALSQAFEPSVISSKEIMQYTNNFLLLSGYLLLSLLLVPQFLHRDLRRIHQPRDYQLAMLMHLHPKPKNLIQQAHQCIQHQCLPGERRLSDLPLLGCSLSMRLFQRTQDEYFPIRRAGFPFPGTLQAGSFPSSHWPEALLSI